MPLVTKKMLILYIYRILKEYTDENHTLTQKEIADLLKKNYDMTADRKSIKRNLSDLIEAGYDIDYKEIPRSSSDDEDSSLQMTDFKLNHEFSEGELHMLTDGIVFSRNIPVKQRKDLIEKLERLSSKYFKSNAKSIITVQTEGNSNKELFLNIETINEAILKNKRIDFNYLEYHTDKKLHKRITKNGKIRRFTVSPYNVAAINGRYYVISNNDWFGDDLSHFRLDRITNLKITEEKRRPESEINGLKKGFSLSKHMTEHVYMFSDAAVRITFRMDKKLLNELFDWFDAGSLTFYDEDESFVTVSTACSPQSMQLWATQFSKFVTILSPKSLAEAVYKDLKAAAERYEKM